MGRGRERKEHSVGMEREREREVERGYEAGNQIARQLWGYILVRFSTEVSQREEDSNAPLLASLQFHPSFRFSRIIGFLDRNQ